MKITLYLKDPDGVYESVSEAVKETLPEGLSPKESGEFITLRINQEFDKLKKWVQLKEYVTVEIDTDTEETKVLRQASGLHEIDPKRW